MRNVQHLTLKLFQENEDLNHGMNDVKNTDECDITRNGLKMTLISFNDCIYIMYGLCIWTIGSIDSAKCGL